MGRVKKAALSGRGAELERAYRKQDLTGRGQGGAVQAGDRRAPWGPKCGVSPVPAHPPAEHRDSGKYWGHKVWGVREMAPPFPRPAHLLTDAIPVCNSRAKAHFLGTLSYR